LRQIIALGSLPAALAPVVERLDDGWAEAAVETSNAQKNRDFFMNLTRRKMDAAG
jgi:hypothetical protein